MKARFAFVIALLFALTTFQPHLALAQPTQSSELSVARSIDPSILPRLAELAGTNPDGAMGGNRSGFLQVGLQTSAIYVAANAVLSQNPNEVDRALKMLEYGFAHMRPDGTFEFRMSNGVVKSGGVTAGPINIAGNSAFFLMDVGRTLNVLDDSQWVQREPSLSQARTRIARLWAQSALALRRLDAEYSLLMSDQGAVNRQFIYALAYYTLGDHFGDPAAMSDAHGLIHKALSEQTSDGTFLEGGGFDSSYQGVSLYMAQALIVSMNANDSYRGAIWNGVKRGMSREMLAISPNGDVSTAGNTRVSATGEKIFGQRKHVDVTSLTMALSYYAVLANDPSSRAYALAVARRLHLLPS